MFRRLANVSVVLTLTLSLGAHWLLLQSVAWVGMVVTYSQDAAFTEALSKTFDGRHPCQLCKIVQKGKAREKKQDRQKPTIKLDEFLAVKQSVYLYPPKPERLASTVLSPSLPRCDSPPTPPPERA